MAAVAKGVALSLGLITASVSVNSANESKSASGNVQVCDAGHPAERIRAPKVCGQCGEVPFQQLKLARPVEGGLVVIEREEMAEAKSDSAAFKKRAAITAHPVEQVGVLTSSGEKMYYLTPDTGHETAYSTLLALVVNHPELAFMTQWTPRTALGQYQVLMYEGVLVLQERVAGSNVRTPPELNLQTNEQLVGLAEQVLAMDGSITDYNPETYADKFEERIAAIIANKEVVPVAGTSAPITVTAAGVDDLMARLTAELAAAAPKVPAKKRTTRKKAAASA